MEKIRFLAILALGILIGCSNNELVGDPSLDSPTESIWRSHYPVTLNEDEESFILHYSYGSAACRITSKSAEWVDNTFKIPLTVHYKLGNGTLAIWYEDDVNDVTNYTGDSESIIGTWNSTDGKHTIQITKDMFYTTEKPASGTTIQNEPVESEINLITSYFVFDLYGCVKGGDYICHFSHWHFTKPAPTTLLSNIERTFEFREYTDRYANLGYGEKNFIIQVEHVQLDSLNNGQTNIRATIESEGVTCLFEYAAMPPNEKVCLAENVETLSMFTYKDDDGKTYANRYFKDNSSEFSYCVSNMVK